MSIFCVSERTDAHGRISCLSRFSRTSSETFRRLQICLARFFTCSLSVSTEPKMRLSIRVWPLKNMGRTCTWSTRRCEGMKSPSTTSGKIAPPKTFRSVALPAPRGPMTVTSVPWLMEMLPGKFTGRSMEWKLISMSFIKMFILFMDMVLSSAGSFANLSIVVLSRKSMISLRSSMSMGRFSSLVILVRGGKTSCNSSHAAYTS
mmetsp:Transcript_34226/g.79614  ORF Transcript_34226/g.79614 Transcript_34226/m.79614 type:complete len:204 (-) Transcript_34226:2064-2675(-)